MMFSQNDKYSDVSLKLIIQIHQRVLFSTLCFKWGSLHSHKWRYVFTPCRKTLYRYPVDESIWCLHE
jgi:hypothetical protein